MSEDSNENQIPPTAEELQAEVDKLKEKLAAKTKEVGNFKMQAMQSKILLTKAQGDLKKEKEQTKKFLDAYNNMKHRFDFLKGVVYIFDERGDLIHQIKHKSFGEIGANYKLSKKLNNMFREYMEKKFTYFMDRKVSNIKKPK